MDIFEAIEGRRSVHSFTAGKRIPRADLEKLITLATKSPSSWNLQPWKFLVIEDDAKRAEIRKMAWDQNIITDSSALVLVLGTTDAQANKEEILDQWRSNGIINDQVHATWMQGVGAVYPTEYEQHEFAIRNSSFAAMTLMLAAHGMGMVSCPMIGFDKKAVSGFVGVKAPWILSFMLSLGYSEGGEAFPRQQRYGLDKVLCIDELS
jgi:nitroreductase